MDRIRELPYVGERVAALDQEALYEFARANAPLAGQVYSGALGFIGGVFGTVLNFVLMLIISVYPNLDRERGTRATLGAIPAVLIPLFTGNYVQALLIAALFLVAQQIVGNVLVPRFMGGSTGVHPLWVLFATMAAAALYGLVGAVFAVPIVVIIAAVFRYLRGTLLFERWHKVPVFTPGAGETAERPTPEEDPTGEVPAVTDGGKSSPGTGGKGL